MTSTPVHVRRLFQDVTQRVRTAPDRSTASIRSLRKEYSVHLARLDPPDVLQLALLLRGSRVVHRFFADELIANHRPAMAALTRRDLEIIGNGMNSWDQVDSFATIVAGPALRSGIITDADVKRWARSNDRWWRRAALVCTTRLNVRGATSEARRTLSVCSLLVDDRDDMVVKAMSWALRALARRDPESVEAFIRHHRIRLAPRVVREVTNKVRTGLKTPRR